MSLEGKLGKFKKYLVDSTAYSIIPTVVPAYYEPHFAEFSDEVSISARILNGMVCYSGVASSFVWARKKMNFSKNQGLIDSTIMGVGLFIGGSLLYWTLGETDVSKIAVGASCSAALGFFLGPVGGYTIDLFNDLTGIERSSRIPKLISNAKKSSKRVLLASILAASTGLVALSYELSPDTIELDEFKLYQMVLEATG